MLLHLYLMTILNIMQYRTLYSQNPKKSFGKFSSKPVYRVRKSRHRRPFNIFYFILNVYIFVEVKKKNFLLIYS
jgi:hypothetical protein